MIDRMDIQAQARSLLKILIGVAWLDGQIQPQERQYLTTLAQTHQLDRDPEIDTLLTSPTRVTPDECERWIQAYLGDRSIYDDDELIEAISGLIYSDGDVATAEANLLVNIQSEPTVGVPTPQPLVAKIRQLYQNWCQKIRSE
ncbi:TerB family tellurite resistance protein [Chamaesiphon sp. OTE_8_metabat_110]|uniref:tellurite resistance TerB family protein n=1 Tax=Chamaesiphon sp. OTE_8_metabat_110 TaxID=2964696 RepID=UPI00286C419D|nr:TerB family tellurite resistance protein [Chamaesiphon sp. OTE_8_metabat_110]